ncbi:hypothetical protein ACC686_36345, partial [Rhizobium johnstonii]
VDFDPLKGLVPFSETAEVTFAADDAALTMTLSVAYICPWASRTLIGRKLKGLEDIISVSVVAPLLGKQGWRFGDYPGATEDHVN